MKKIGVIYNPTRKKNLLLARKIENYLSKKNISIAICKAGPEKSEWDKLKGNLDFALVLGGDGTLLSACRVLGVKGIPVFGINTGHLGFLTEGKKGDVIKLLQQIIRRKYVIDKRAMLSVKINGKVLYALNDVVISRGASRKMVHMALSVNGQAASDYIADGLIISTPTGSTAYALSAGGAVMEPEVEGIEIVPICAHSLTSRPHIVSDKKELLVAFNQLHEGMILQIDGQETFELNHRAKIKIKRSKHIAKLLRLKGKENDFYYRIRQKFHWGQTTK